MRSFLGKRPVNCTNISPETAVPYTAFASAGYTITIATQNGVVPACDDRMLYGWTQAFLGATKHVVTLYESMKLSPAWQHPQSWSDRSFTLEAFDLVFLPGGHDKAVRQILDCPRAHSLLVSYFPLTRRSLKRAPDSRPKVCAAVCHGVQVLAHAKTPNGKSILHDVETTTLPDFFESSVYASTRLFLGDYYKTYGAGTENVATVVRAALDDGANQFRNSIDATRPFVVEDKRYRYISARWPGDAEEMARRIIGALDSSS